MVAGDDAGAQRTMKVVRGEEERLTIAKKAGLMMVVRDGAGALRMTKRERG